MVDPAMVALCFLLISVGIVQCLVECVNKKWPNTVEVSSISGNPAL